MSALNFDLLVRGRRIFAGQGWLDGAVAIRDGRIEVVLPADALPGDAAADEVIEAGDRWVLPGMVDTHAHFRDPGLTHKEDWLTGSSAAAAGGVTTVIDMPNVEPPPNNVERFVAHRDNAARKSVIDFGHHVAGTIPEEIPGLAAAGASGFKVFMKRDVARSYPHMPGTAVDDHATLYRICEAVAETGLPLLVHPDDQSLAELFLARASATTGRGALSYARAMRGGSGVIMDTGIATMLALQRATGVRLHLLHVSTVGGWQMIRAAKAEGRAVTAEVNPFHLFVNDWATVERWGPYVLGQWVPDADAEATWEAVLDRTADILGSDHTPHAASEKAGGWDDMFATPGGSPTIQHALALLLTGVRDGRLPLERVVELWCTAPAAFLGLAGRKGVVAPGADADLVIVDSQRAQVIRDEDVVSRAGYTVLAGRELVGLPEITISRGRVVWRDGRIVADPGSGRWLGPR